MTAAPGRAHSCLSHRSRPQGRSRPLVASPIVCYPTDPGGDGRGPKPPERESGPPKPAPEATLLAQAPAWRTPGRNPASVSAISKPGARPQVHKLHGTPKRCGQGGKGHGFSCLGKRGYKVAPTSSHACSLSPSLLLGFSHSPPLEPEDTAVSHSTLTCSSEVWG